MVDKTGTLKIIDIGSDSIAGLEETRHDSLSTYLLGTALYSAPEYFLSEQGDVQSELFSLGVITYYLKAISMIPVMFVLKRSLSKESCSIRPC
jgi:serine/threonine protein kinase